MTEIDTDLLEKLGYIHQSDIAFVITRENIVDMCECRNGYVGDFEWTPELVKEHWGKFVKNLEWSGFEMIEDIIIQTAQDIECEVGFVE